MSNTYTKAKYKQDTRNASIAPLGGGGPPAPAVVALPTQPYMITPFVENPTEISASNYVHLGYVEDLYPFHNVL